MFVALSRFVIRTDLAAETRRAFAERPHLVDAASGFLGMQVMSPIEDPKEFWLVTRWTDEQSYKAWHRSHAYHDSHQGFPKGLKLVKGSAHVRFFDMFAE
jgi:heme-degrading monooxygenase HmoA